MTNNMRRFFWLWVVALGVRPPPHDERWTPPRFNRGVFAAEGRGVVKRNGRVSTYTAIFPHMAKSVTANDFSAEIVDRWLVHLKYIGFSTKRVATDWWWRLPREAPPQFMKRAIPLKKVVRLEGDETGATWRVTVQF